MKRIFIFIAFLIPVFLAFFGHTKPAYAAACTISPASSTTAYGDDFQIVINDPNTNKDESKRFVLKITGKDIQRPEITYASRPYEKVNNQNKVFSHEFNFKNDNEDNGDDLGKLSHLPPLVDSQGRQQTATYDIIGMIEYGDETVETCAGILTVLPATKTEFPTITPYPAISLTPTPVGGEVGGSQFEVLPQLVGKSGDDYTVTSQWGPTEDQIVNGDTTQVKITFPNMDSGRQYLLCFQTDQKRCFETGEFDNEDTTANSNGALVVENICGAGKEAVKKRANNGLCEPFEDYFHPGSLYAVGVYDKDFSSGPLRLATFYVYRNYPHVELKQPGLTDNFSITLNQGNLCKEDDPKTKENESQNCVIDNPVQVRVQQTVKPGGKKRNNFQIVLESKDGYYKSEKCVSVGTYDGDNNATNVGALADSDWVTFTYGDLVDDSGNSSPVPVGQYTLKINEQNDEGSTRVGDSCKGGFTYYEADVDVAVVNESLETTIDRDSIKKDPGGEESDLVKEFFDLPKLPCVQWMDEEGKLIDNENLANYLNQRHAQVGSDNEFDPAKYLQCAKVRTALGVFSTDPMAFVGDVMRWIIAIACLGAVTMLVYSGYLLIYSRGDKEKIQNAKDNIKALVIGLIFILLSVSILQFIGVDILGLDFLSR